MFEFGKLGKILESFLWCAGKGILLPVSDSDHLFDNNWGFSDRKMVAHWNRLDNKDEKRSHRYTNLLVEWTRGNAQLATKISCGTIGVLTLCLLASLLI